MSCIIIYLNESKKLNDYHHNKIKDYTEIDLNPDEQIKNLKSEKERLEKEVKKLKS